MNKKSFCPFHQPNLIFRYSIKQPEALKTFLLQIKREQVCFNFPWPCFGSLSQSQGAHLLGNDSGIAEDALHHSHKHTQVK